MTGSVFVKLIPVNVLAKLAFSDVYDRLTANRQNNDTENGHLSCISLSNTEQEYDNGVFRFKFEIEHSLNESDGSETEPNTPSTPSDQDGRAGGMIWVGCYLVGFDPGPLDKDMGWTIGKGLRGDGTSLSSLPSSVGGSLAECGSGVDILLCTRAFLKKYNVYIRGVNARLNFARDNMALTLIKPRYRSQLSHLTINDESVEQRVFALNQHQMKICFDKLEYKLEYTDYARSADFNKARAVYLRFLNGPKYRVPVELPSPPRNTRTIGQWTLVQSIGEAGSLGKVFMASNAKNELAAVKMSTVTANMKAIVDQEIATSEAVTKLAEEWDHEGRIVRQIDVIRLSTDDFSYRGHPGEVAMVLQPLIPHTFKDLIHRKATGLEKGMSIEAACAFREALLGLKVMHDHRWQHGDLKPRNIGFCEFPLRVVILDIGQSKQLKPEHIFLPTPGCRGSVGYIAPESEIHGSNLSADIWAMGVVGHQLTYGHHPWPYTTNPWRPGEEYEKLRPEWYKKYDGVLKKLLEDHRRASQSPSKGYIHLGALIHDMLTLDPDPGLDTALGLASENINCRRRIGIDEVLEHSNWGASFLPERPEDTQVKKARLDDQLGPRRQESKVE